MKRNMWMNLWLILAVIFVIYGIMIRTLASGTGFFLVWIALGVGCALFALAAKLGIWSRLAPGLKGIFLAIVALGICLFLVVEGFVVSGFTHRGEPDLDYILVLGAQVFEDRPSIVLQYRLDAAAQYLQENPRTLCIVSGGQGANEPFPEAVGMRNYLLQVGIDEERIFMEDKSMNTDQNIMNSMEMMPEGVSVGVVTNNFHVYRGVITAKRHGLTRAVGIPAGSNPAYLPNNMFREFFGVLKYWMMGAKS